MTHPSNCIFCGDLIFETDERGPIITGSDGAQYHYLCGLEWLERQRTEQRKPEENEHE